MQRRKLLPHLHAGLVVVFQTRLSSTPSTRSGVAAPLGSCHWDRPVRITGTRYFHAIYGCVDATGTIDPAGKLKIAVSMAAAWPVAASRVLDSAGRLALYKQVRRADGPTQLRRRRQAPQQHLGQPDGDSKGTVAVTAPAVDVRR